jgi:hypothetical protein
MKKLAALLTLLVVCAVVPGRQRCYRDGLTQWESSAGVFCAISPTVIDEYPEPSTTWDANRSSDTR